MTGMLFRPEEVHARSAIGTGFDRTAHLTVGVTHDGFGLNGEKVFILHLNHHGLSAVQTVGVQTHLLAGKQPANRQRFEASLGEPFLLAVYGHAVLGRLVVEGWKGSDPVRLRMEPAGNAGGHQIVEQLAPFFHANAQILGQFGVVGRLPGVDKTLHDVVKKPDPAKRYLSWSNPPLIINHRAYLSGIGFDIGGILVSSYPERRPSLKSPLWFLPKSLLSKVNLP